jgi:hypothetical protein
MVGAWRFFFSRPRDHVTSETIWICSLETDQVADRVPFTSDRWRKEGDFGRPTTLESAKSWQTHSSLVVFLAEKPLNNIAKWQWQFDGSSSGESPLAAEGGPPAVHCAVRNPPTGSPSVVQKPVTIRVILLMTSASLQCYTTLVSVGYLSPASTDTAHLHLSSAIRGPGEKPRETHTTGLLTSFAAVFLRLNFGNALK